MINGYTKKNPFKSKIIFTLIWAIFLLHGCTSVTNNVLRGPAPTPVSLPFLRLEQAGECYFIDDFLPTPDSLVTGKTNGLSLRYYTYWNARYKFWTNVGIMLSFYSKDSRCWGLFEEYVLPQTDEDSADAEG